MSPRRCHVLRGDKTTQTIQNAIFVDTETYEVQVTPNKVSHHLKFGWAALTRRKNNGGWCEPDWFRFDKIDNFWVWVYNKCRHKTKTYLFCHNTNFDLPVLDIFNKLPDFGWELKFACIQAPPTILKFVREKRTLVVCDTLNWWPVPLKKLGKSLGLNKLDMPGGEEDPKNWDAYCRRDVEIILVAVQTWCDFIFAHDLGNFAFTTAGQALKTFTHRFLSAKIMIHNNDKSSILERLAYKGGRNECFKLGHFTGPWYLYDVNSMYPAVMLKYKYPVKLKYHSNNKTIKWLAEKLINNAVVARVIVKVHEPCYSVRYNKKLCFPTGEFICSLSTPELIYGLKHNFIIKVLEVSVYKTDYVFADYVRYMYDARQREQEKNNEIGSNHYKLLMNSLYGKFGQKGLVYEESAEKTDLECGCWTEIDAETGETRKFRTLAGLTQELSCETENINSFPAVAAHVTAYARMYLWKLIKTAGINNVAYTDTDSLVVNLVGKRNLTPFIDRHKLGKIKLENTFESITIYGCKDYEFDNKKRTKGAKKSAVWISDNKLAQEKWSSLRGLLRAGDMTKPTTEAIYKHLSRVYNKANVSKSGSVTPYVFDLSTSLDE